LIGGRKAVAPTDRGIFLPHEGQFRTTICWRADDSDIDQGIQRLGHRVEDAAHVTVLIKPR
jgi:hypothetical protein